MSFTVIRPIYERTGEYHETKDGGLVPVERVARWVEVGPAESAEDARSRYSPVQFGYALILKETR